MNCDREAAKFAVGDVVDNAIAVKTALKKETVIDRINKRNKDRQNYLDVKLELRNKENLQIEGADYFADKFTERVRAIESRLKDITEMAATKSGGSSNELSRPFADVAIELQELQRYLTASTIFLADYKIKACQNVVNELTTNCDELRDHLMPKKKFGFSGRKVAPKVILNPKVAAHKGDPSNNGLATANHPSSIFKWTLCDRKSDYIRLSDTEVNGKDITIANLANCFVELQGHAGSVQISQATDCTFLFGPIERSLFAERCHNCIFALACQQLRLHSSDACRIYLHVTSRAIIEDCKRIEVATYCYDYPDIDNDFAKAALDKSQNNYADVGDFNWLASGVQSPNWALLKDNTKPNWSDLRRKFKQKLSDKNTTATTTTTTATIIEEPMSIGDKV